MLESKLPEIRATKYIHKLAHFRIWNWVKFNKSYKYLNTSVFFIVNQIVHLQFIILSLILMLSFTSCHLLIWSFINSLYNSSNSEWLLISVETILLSTLFIYSSPFLISIFETSTSILRRFLLFSFFNQNYIKNSF